MTEGRIIVFDLIAHIAQAIQHSFVCADLQYKLHSQPNSIVSDAVCVLRIGSSWHSGSMNRLTSGCGALRLQERSAIGSQQEPISLIVTFPDRGESFASEQHWSKESVRS